MSLNGIHSKAHLDLLAVVHNCFKLKVYWIFPITNKRTLKCIVAKIDMLWLALIEIKLKHFLFPGKMLYRHFSWHNLMFGSHDSYISRMSAFPWKYELFPCCDNAESEAIQTERPMNFIIILIHFTYVSFFSMCLHLHYFFISSYSISTCEHNCDIFSLLHLSSTSLGSILIGFILEMCERWKYRYASRYQCCIDCSYLFTLWRVI